MLRFVRLLPILLFVGCSESSAPSLDTGLPRETPANEVTPAEAQQACLRYEALANEALGEDVQVVLGCTLSGVISELTGGGTCESTTATCVSSGTVEPAPVDFDCENAVTFAPSGCTATIGELEDCVTAVTRSIDSITSQIDCSLVDHLDELGGLADDVEGIVDPSTNPACSGLSMECLGLLGWTEASAPTFPGMP